MLAHYDLARIAYLKKHWVRVVDHARTAMEMHKTTHESNSHLAALQCEWYLAAALRFLRQDGEAAKVYDRLFNSSEGHIVGEPTHITLFDIKICLSRTRWQLQKCKGCDQVSQEAPTFPKQLSEENNPYIVRSLIFQGELAYQFSDFAKAGDKIAEALDLLDPEDSRDLTPVPMGYLHSMLAIIYWKTRKEDEALGHALSALETDCNCAYQCISVEGFAEIFAQLISMNLDPVPSAEPAINTGCTAPVHQAVSTEASTISSSTASAAVGSTTAPPPSTMLTHRHRIDRANRIDRATPSFDLNNGPAVTDEMNIKSEQEEPKMEDTPTVADS